MPDPRFFEDLGPVRLGELAGQCGAKAPAGAEDRLVSGVAILARAAPGTITFLADRKHAGQLTAGMNGLCFVRAADADALPQGWLAVTTNTPQAAYALAAQRLHRPRAIGAKGAREALVEEGAVIEPGVVLGEGSQIGRGARIGANTVIGPGVAIGRDSDIGPNVTIVCALLGDRVRVLAGAVIGEPGFGATAGPRGLMDIPQLGRVIIQDNVTIGANTTVDRGAFEDTVIGENTKIDNLVQIAHNVRIGRNCAIAAQVGFAGSVTVGDGVQFGGQAAVADHLTIGASARIGGQAGVLKDIPAGETWSGTPARPLRQWLKETAWIARMANRKGSSDE
jgi:UDP-3-O-[3-hydroxymyristoyl] glucosamine N-acyltransferase